MLNARTKYVRERIRAAAERSNRPADSVCLVAVTKGVSVGLIAEILKSGVTHIAENRVQEALMKQEALAKYNATRHMIGHLQTNKAKKAAEIFDMVQSIDSPKLAATLDRAAAEQGKILPSLVEVKISEEATKSGIAVEDARDFVKNFRLYKNLSLQGLMTIAPFGLDEAGTRDAFRRFKRFFDSLRDYFGVAPVLSMGMSSDFEIAIEEGSTMVRIGTALFGTRSEELRAKSEE